MRSGHKWTQVKDTFSLIFTLFAVPLHKIENNKTK